MSVPAASTSTETAPGIGWQTLPMARAALQRVPRRGFLARIPRGFPDLAILMLPIIIRTTEEMLKLVPHSLREGSLALGAPEWKTSIKVLFPAALNGIITGFLLAIARAAGETAPLLFTALGNEHYDLGLIVQNGIQLHQPIWQILGRILNQPADSLPLTLWKYAQQPYPERVDQSWAVALILMIVVLLINISARLWIETRKRRLQG